MMALQTKLIIGAGVGLLAAFAWMARNGATGAGQAAGAAVVDLADGVLTGAVVGAGSLAGIPATNLTQCQKDKAAGNTWDASFSCPAKEFISYWWNK